jgi:DNA-binding MarR family transcriptional regulator
VGKRLQEQEDSYSKKIIHDLHRCGHFLHFKMGGKGGRRRIFFVLVEHGEILQRELQDLLGLQSGSMSEIIIKMEADGLIEKIKSEQDGRQFILRLTAKGIAEAKRREQEYLRQVTKMTSCFSKTEQQEFYGMLERLLEHWEQMDAQGGFSMPPKEPKESQLSTKTMIQKIG